MTFNDLTFLPSTYADGVHAIVTFDNGYGASIVKTDRSYGGKEGLYELAVLFDGLISYDTPITNDVIGFLTEDEVTELLQKIEDL
jgi:hypothetical protein